MASAWQLNMGSTRALFKVRNPTWKGREISKIEETLSRLNEEVEKSEKENVYLAGKQKELEKLVKEK